MKSQRSTIVRSRPATSSSFRGQEFDVVVSMAPGKYYFQCDPHALLGMVGELEVEDEDD